MGLATYQSKRDFARTTEPRGKAATRKRVAPAQGGAFVVQKHGARSLHYDFRLELDGVLLSWAVPKGPSLDPSVKRLAMQTEDHPLEYAGFEGVIPPGQYGAGPVVVWDEGRWIPDGDARASYAAGRLTFRLEGKKLHGGFHLVRTNGRAAKNGKARSWLLMKRNDDAAERGSGSQLVDSAPASVKTGRTLEQVGIAPERTWRSNRAAASASPKPVKPRAAKLPKNVLVPALQKAVLTHPERVLYPEQGITKAELALYYAQVAERMLPHVADRPLMLVRCPEGARKQCFHQKHPTDSTSPAIGRVRIAEKKATREYMTIDDAEGLIALVQVGALEIHSWGSRAHRLEYPDQLTFDLDPDEGLPWSRVTEAASELRARLAALDLPSYLKVTGGKGLHVVVPIAAQTPWDDAKQLCKAFVERWEREQPARYVTNIAKAKRRGKILLDYLRNGRGATAIAPYSTRARAGAPVALPVSWDELDELDPAELTLRTVPARIAKQRRDPWRGFGVDAPRLTAAHKRALRA